MSKIKRVGIGVCDTPVVYSLSIVFACNKACIPIETFPIFTDGEGKNTSTINNLNTYT